MTLSSSKNAVIARRRRVSRGIEAESEAKAFTNGSIQRAVQLPLLFSLDEAGGAARPRDVYDKVADSLEIDQSARDETRDCGDGRSYKVFQQQVRWARQTAVMQGLIAGERGRWELTDSGYEKLGKIKRGAAILLFSTDDGFALWAHAEDAAEFIEPNSVKLVLTSPPYPVVRRAYGRFTVPEWLEWMKRLAAIWKGLISADGTIAINLMDVFVGGAPVLSPYIERFALAAIDDVGLHLAGRMMWHSPSKLGNIQWTSTRKLQPKNTLEHILLFSKSASIDWDIRRMERGEYARRTASQRRRDDKRTKEIRPSGLDINPSAFGGDLGPLPGNLIISGGVSGNDTYSKIGRAHV